MATKHPVDTRTFFERNPVFSLGEAARSLHPSGGRTGMVHRLKHHVGTGRLQHVARGIYAVVPRAAVADRFRPDPILVARAIRPDGIFSFYSALALLGAAHSVSNEHVVVSERRRRSLQLNGARIHFLTHPVALQRHEAEMLGTRRVEHRGRVVRVTGPERTLVDGFRRPDLAGGLEELVLSAGGFPILDLDLLERVLAYFENATLWAAVGWFLEQHQQTFQVPDSCLERLETHRPRSAHYLVRGSRGGTLNTRWNLILPATATAWMEPDEP